MHEMQCTAAKKPRPCASSFQQASDMSSKWVTGWLHHFVFSGTVQWRVMLMVKTSMIMAITLNWGRWYRGWWSQGCQQTGQSFTLLPPPAGSVRSRSHIVYEDWFLATLRWIYRTCMHYITPSTSITVTTTAMIHGTRNFQHGIESELESIIGTSDNQSLKLLNGIYIWKEEHPYSDREWLIGKQLKWKFCDMTGKCRYLVMQWASHVANMGSGNLEQCCISAWSVWLWGRRNKLTRNGNACAYRLLIVMLWWCHVRLRLNPPTTWQTTMHGLHSHVLITFSASDSEALENGRIISAQQHIKLNFYNNFCICTKLFWLVSVPH